MDLRLERLLVARAESRTLPTTGMMMAARMPMMAMTVSSSTRVKARGDAPRGGRPGGTGDSGGARGRGSGAGRPEEDGERGHVWFGGEDDAESLDGLGREAGGVGEVEG